MKIDTYPPCVPAHIVGDTNTPIGQGWLTDALPNGRVRWLLAAALTRRLAAVAHPNARTALDRAADGAEEAADQPTAEDAAARLAGRGRPPRWSTSTPKLVRHILLNPQFAFADHNALLVETVSRLVREHVSHLDRFPPPDQRHLAAAELERIGQWQLAALFAPQPGWQDNWNTEHATMLAETTYQQKAWDKLPVLADALEEAGCDHWILKALRECPDKFCRGVWVLDRLTGRR